MNKKIHDSILEYMELTSIGSDIFNTKQHSHDVEWWAPRSGFR